jgi:hypothetical protein
VAKRLAFQADREVRHTVIRVIANHLKKDSTKSWQGLNFDFTGVVFDGGSFAYAVFSGGTVDFRGAVFSGGTVDFNFALFSGSSVYFSGAKFSGGTVEFASAYFSGGWVFFDHAYFSRGKVNFHAANFCGPGAPVDFRGAEFSGSTVDFSATFSGGPVDFTGAKFCGSTVSFRRAGFSGSTVDFSKVRVWRYPPQFDWATDAAPPKSVMLPEAPMGADIPSLNLGPPPGNAPSRPPKPAGQDDELA